MRLIILILVLVSCNRPDTTKRDALRKSMSELDSSMKALHERQKYTQHELEMISILRKLGRTKKQMKTELDSNFMNIHQPLPQWWPEYQQWRDSALLKLK
jgi:hypothetical protein